MSSPEEQDALRELEEVPAVEVITATAVHLMSAAAVQVGLAESGYKGDLDEAREHHHQRRAGDCQAENPK